MLTLETRRKGVIGGIKNRENQKIKESKTRESKIKDQAPFPPLPLFLRVERFSVPVGMCQG
jgi:hypothetical protein